MFFPEVFCEHSGFYEDFRTVLTGVFVCRSNYDCISNLDTFMVKPFVLNVVINFWKGILLEEFRGASFHLLHIICSSWTSWVTYPPQIPLPFVIVEVNQEEEKSVEVSSIKSLHILVLKHRGLIFNDMTNNIRIILRILFYKDHVLKNIKSISIFISKLQYI